MKNKKSICFLVGSVALSGGTYVIFQHASYLQEIGHEVVLAVQSNFDSKTASWHDRSAELTMLPMAEAQERSYDVVIATWWRTIFDLPQFKTKTCAYFVQSIESLFYSPREVPLRKLVDSTYDLPINYVTEASWIVRHLKSKHSKTAGLVRNGIRKDLYQAQGSEISPRPSSGQPRVLIEGYFGVPFKNTALAVKLARRAECKDIWVLTGSQIAWLPGVSKIFCKIPVTEVPKVYRSCDIIVKLSTVEGMFGPPLEMFHCGGTALVFDVTGHDEYIRDGANAIVVKNRSTDGVVQQLSKAIHQHDLIKQLQVGALATASEWPDWASSSSAFAKWVTGLKKMPEKQRAEMIQRVQASWEAYTLEEQAKTAKRKVFRWTAIASKLSNFLAHERNQIRIIREILNRDYTVS